MHGQDGGYPDFSHSREFQFNLRNSGNSDVDFSDIPFPTATLPNQAQPYNDGVRDKRKNRRKRKWEEGGGSAEIEKDGKTRVQ